MCNLLLLLYSIRMVAMSYHDLNILCTPSGNITYEPNYRNNSGFRVSNMPAWHCTSSKMWSYRVYLASSPGHSQFFNVTRNVDKLHGSGLGTRLEFT